MQDITCRIIGRMRKKDGCYVGKWEEEKDKSIFQPYGCSKVIIRDRCGRLGN